MKLHGSCGSVDVGPGYRFTDSDGMQWEIVRETDSGIYSPVGVGGTNIVECRHIGGEATNIWKRYLKGDLGEWCGDSLACAIIGHQSRALRRQGSGA